MELPYLMGVTTVVVGLSSLATVSPARGVIGYQFKAAGGSLAIADFGASAANGFSTGYYLGASEIVTIPGPSQFYLACAGATSSIRLLTYYSAGYTLYP